MNLGPSPEFLEALAMTDAEFSAHLISGGYFDPKKKAKWKKENDAKFRPDGTKPRSRKAKYGVSQEQYDAMYSTQEGRCAICGVHQSAMKKALCVDHCHATGRVRGLLCNPCNGALGSFRDNLALLDKAKSYLLTTPSKEPASDDE